MLAIVVVLESGDDDEKEQERDPRKFCLPYFFPISFTTAVEPGWGSAIIGS